MWILMDSEYIPDIRISVPLVTSYVHIWHGRYELQEWLKEKGIVLNFTMTKGCALYLTDPDGRGWMVMLLPKKTPIPTIAHECIHMAWQICDHIGVSVRSKDQEMLCRIAEFLLDEILQFKEYRKLPSITREALAGT